MFVCLFFVFLLLFFVVVFKVYRDKQIKQNTENEQILCLWTEKKRQKQRETATESEREERQMAGGGGEGRERRFQPCTFLG